MLRVASLAAWEFEVRDAGAPVEGATTFQVFVGVPEGAVVYRVNAHGTVVTPAA